MVTEKELLNNKQYRFKNLVVRVVEKDNDGNVLVFGASFVKASADGKISPGVMDFNDLIRRPDDPSVARGAKSKRPPGYWLLDTIEHAGVSNAFFVADEWMDQNPKDVRTKKIGEWTADLVSRKSA